MKVEQDEDNIASDRDIRLSLLSEMSLMELVEFYAEFWKRWCPYGWASEESAEKVHREIASRISGLRGF